MLCGRLLGQAGEQVLGVGQVRYQLQLAAHVQGLGHIQYITQGRIVFEGKTHIHSGPRVYASLGAVIAQIIVLDAVFSLDAVITAVGMVDELGVMMAAVVISMAVMIFASKPLTRFVNAHPPLSCCMSLPLMPRCSSSAWDSSWTLTFSSVSA